MRVALVTNAASGSGTDGGRIAALLRDAGAEVAVHAFDPDDGDGAIDAAAAAAAAERPDRLAVAGGDGSIGPVAVHAAAADLPLAVIPTGTANDFARALDIPRDLEAACALAAHETRERPIDLLARRRTAVPQRRERRALGHRRAPRAAAQAPARAVRLRGRRAPRRAHGEAAALPRHGRRRPGPLRRRPGR